MDTTPAKLVRIGYLHAHIGYDTRYSDDLYVHWDPNTDTVRVRVFTTGAVGGMDGGRSDSYEPRADFDQTCQPVAKEVMALIKKCTTSDRFNFKQYGKPTKNFRWVPNTAGLNTTNCRGAIAWARETHRVGQ
jgi:hypothetical protein